MPDLKIVHEPSDDDPYIIVYKPHGLPSAPLNGNQNAFSLVAQLYPGLLNVHGKKELEHGLVHRLDNDAAGLLLICTTQTSYDRMLEAQKNGLFIKKYNAQCDLIPDNIDRLGGFPVLDISGCIKENTGFEVESYFRPYGEGRKTVRPVTGSSCNAGLKKSGTVLYHTQVNVLKIEQEKVYAECEISAGFRHQVRCHLAWCGIPVSGDMLYNSQYVQDQVLQFECTELRFPHPLTDKVIIYSLK